ncbi:uncharacterized protein LTR77_001554 [Saxophila tyrrhenica]|uniref:C2H2-type domain-containing protein n=1 Tax=Saxophila tyrrhenica TaxID=1690608 RepID=A0AAV9PP07_9PEZI|nr:hypothetical protein LTR77_001554 [Saxophila tyrrhenica]
MDHNDAYARSPPRVAARDRDDYRNADPYARRGPIGAVANYGVDSYRPKYADSSNADRRRGDRDRRRSRSRSPSNIDRYQPSERVPRDDYYGPRGRDDGHRERRRSSPQPPAIDRYVPGMPEPTPPPMLHNPMADPMKLEFQVGFTWFAEWWRSEQRVKEEKERARTGRPAPRLRGEREIREDREAERPKIQAAYDSYKENLQKSQAQTFVRLHKQEDWFRERYVSESRDAFRRRLMDYRQGLFAQFQHDLFDGKFDEFTLEGIYKTESNGFGGVMEKEEGEATAAAEVLGVGDLLPSKGGDIRDEAALVPTLLIKTIAPTVTREKFEAFAKEHLGEGAGGFKHLSLSDPNPLKKCHRMGWILLNEGSEANDESEAIVPAEAQPEQDGAEEGESNGDAMQVQRPLSTSEKALRKIDKETIKDPERGDFTVHCGVHRPPEATRKKALWDLFSAPERIDKDLGYAERLVRKLDNELGDTYIATADVGKRVESLVSHGLLQPAEKPTKEMDMDQDVEEGEEDEGIVDEDESDDAELLEKKKRLDLLVEYLRRVHNFCFFCVFEADSVHELQRKCPGGHLRRPRSSLTSAAKEVARASALGEPFPLKRSGASKNDSRDGVADPASADVEMGFDLESPTEEKKPEKMLKPSARNAMQLQRAYNWVKTFEEKIQQILEPEKVNLKKLGGVPVEEGLEEELTKYVKQEDISKYRCKVPECTKLFKGTDFWRKHVEKRHVEWYQQLRADVELVNTYVLDPAHIAPSRSDANSNGHFPIGNNVPTGTPRGFNLNQHMPMGYPLAAGVPGNAMSMFPPGMSMPPGFNPMAMPGMQGGFGPVRSGGRHMMNNGRMGGPYARNDGRGRGPGGRGGMPMMPPGMGMGMSMEGGAGAMGPQEAVQGRSLRSYEDLDAAGPEKETTAELDY